MISEKMKNTSWRFRVTGDLGLKIGGSNHISMGDLQDPKMEVPTIYKAYIRPM
jgi:hypothetical protein